MLQVPCDLGPPPALGLFLPWGSREQDDAYLGGCVEGQGPSIDKETEPWCHSCKVSQSELALHPAPFVSMVVSPGVPCPIPVLGARLGQGDAPTLTRVPPGPGGWAEAEVLPILCTAPCTWSVDCLPQASPFRRCKTEVWWWVGWGVAGLRPQSRRPASYAPPPIPGPQAPSMELFLTCSREFGQSREWLLGDLRAFTSELPALQWMSCLCSGQGLGPGLPAHVLSPAGVRGHGQLVLGHTWSAWSGSTGRICPWLFPSWVRPLGEAARQGTLKLQSIACWGCCPPPPPRCTALSPNPGCRKHWKVAPWGVPPPLS